jgi:hypothetical protein
MEPPFEDHSLQATTATVLGRPRRRRYFDYELLALTASSIAASPEDEQPTATISNSSDMSVSSRNFNMPLL